MTEKMTTQELYGEALRLRCLANTADKLAADATRVAIDTRARADAAIDAFYLAQAPPTFFPQKETS